MDDSLINNSTRPLCNPIWSVIILMINKSITWAGLSYTGSEIVPTNARSLTLMGRVNKTLHAGV